MGMHGGTGDCDGQLIDIQRRLFDSPTASLERGRAREEALRIKEAYDREIMESQLSGATSLVAYALAHEWPVLWDSRKLILYVPGYHPDD